MAKGSFLFVILDPAEEEAEWKIVSPGALGAFQPGGAVGAWAVPAPGPSLQPGGAGGTQGLEANVAVLRGERRGMESLGYCLELLFHSECKSCPWNIQHSTGCHNASSDIV